MRQATDAAESLLPLVVRILDRVTPDWVQAHKNIWEGEQQHVRRCCLRAAVLLERELELLQNLGDDAPDLDAGQLHPWVWVNASSYWRTGHRRQAVVEAAKRINAETQAKVSRRDVSEGALFQQVFSIDNPAPGRPRLRLCEDDGGDTFKNRHIGAANLAKGLYSAIRNPVSHESVAEEIKEHLALEQLAAFSILARWVDGAVLLTKSD